jgi:hypothetical protein
MRRYNEYNTSFSVQGEMVKVIDNERSSHLATSETDLNVAKVTEMIIEEKTTERGTMSL